MSAAPIAPRSGVFAADPIGNHLFLMRGVVVTTSAYLATLLGIDHRGMLRLIKQNVARLPGKFAFEVGDFERQSFLETFGPDRDLGNRGRTYALTKEAIALLIPLVNTGLAIRFSIAAVQQLFFLQTACKRTVAVDLPTQRKGPRMKKDVKDLFDFLGQMEIKAQSVMPDYIRKQVRLGRRRQSHSISRRKRRT